MLLRTMLSHSPFKMVLPVAMLLGVTSLPALAEGRLALVIGQSAYKSVPALPNPGNDAKAVSPAPHQSRFRSVVGSRLVRKMKCATAVSNFAGRSRPKEPDTVALVFYAGHGIQVDGENFLIPTDVDPKREADIPMQAVRLNDVLNTLTSVPSKMRLRAAQLLPQQSVP